MVLPVDPNLWRGTVRRRLIVAAVAFGLWTIAVQAKLVYLQVYQHGVWLERAQDQQERTLAVPAPRGEILDRYGALLAYSVDVDVIGAVPALAGPPAEAVARLCGALGDCAPDETRLLIRRFTQGKSWATVRHNVPADRAQRVRALKLPWTVFQKEPHRFYPNRDLAANLLGFVGVDENGEKGRGGLEAMYDEIIRGRAGKVLVVRDGSRKVFESRVTEAAVPGATLELTVDKYLQHVAERELRAGIAEYNAKGGSIVIMEPRTGEILALANAPTFNPNVYAEATPERWRNRAVQDLYEPGSTFKMITATAALEERVVSPDDIIETGNGTIKIGRARVVRDTHAHGAMSFSDVLVKSSNVGAIRVGFRLGAERLGRYVTLFGFGTRLSPDFKGQENAGMVWNPAGWSENTVASVSMGYEIGVTPLQMAAATSTIANGGELVQPRVLRALIRGNRREVVQRRVLRRVMSPATSETLTRILEGVVDEGGTASAARIPGYSISGKTGTAAKLVNGRYSDSDYNASFAGFLPSRQPALTIVVVIDTPRGRGYYGGGVAGPIFKRVAEAALRHLAIPPTFDGLPPVLVPRTDSMRAIPVAGPARPLTIVPALGPQADGRLLLPELRGLSGRAALQALARLGLVARMSGNGVVIAQDPPAGTPMESGGSCRLLLGRTAPAATEGIQP